MKKVFQILLFTIMVGSGVIISTEAKSQQAQVSLSVFQNSLRAHGRWMNHPKYGQIWMSNTRGFVPYSTGGRWSYTDYGWTWVSDYDWGWAPFHYGRWAYERSYGWYWVPGYEWGPAWVAWRNNDDYYGWAPLSPGIRIDAGPVDINIIPYDRWVFTPHRYINSPYVSRYYIPRSRNNIIIKNTTIINNVNIRGNIKVVTGPRREDVERVNKVKIQTLQISNSSRPGKTVVNSKTVNIYRPVINDNDKTIINKNSNNTTVNKNSNNDNDKTVDKDNNNNNNNNNDKQKDQTDKPKKNKDQNQPDKKTKEEKQQDKKKNKPENNPPQVKAKDVQKGDIQKSNVAKNKEHKNIDQKKGDVVKKKNNNPDNQNKEK